MDITELIKCYDNAVPDVYCDYFVDFYNDNLEYAKRYAGNDYEQAPDFTELIYTTFSSEPEHQRFNNHVAMIFDKVATTYRDSVPLQQNFFPKRYAFEHIRIKKYENNNIDQFQPHCDVDSVCSSVRFMNIFCYLNDVDEGGETEFLDFGIKIKPKKGRVVMFPPYWFFPHAGNKPLSGPKYLLATNLHYSNCKDCNGCLIK